MLSYKYFSRVDWTRIRLVLLCTILIVLETSKSTLAASGAASAAASSTGGRIGSSSSASAASASASAGIINRLPRQHQLIQHARPVLSEVDTLLAQVNQLESRQSESLDECARWFSLNLRLAELTGRSAGSIRRGSEIRKKEECDNLQRILDNRNRLGAFERALVNQRMQLEPIGQLLAEYSALREAAQSDEQLAREFNLLANGEEQAFGQLEQHTQLMGELFGRPVKDLVVGASGDSLDRFATLDSSIRALIDEEPVLSDSQLSLLTEQADELERLLADGQLDFYLGRFRYLSGTLDAARTVLLHKVMAPAVRSIHSNEYDINVLDNREADSFGMSAVASAAASLNRHHNPIFSHSPVSSASSAVSSAASAAAGTMPAVSAAHQRLAHFRQRRSVA